MFDPYADRANAACKGRMLLADGTQIHRYSNRAISAPICSTLMTRRFSPAS